MQNANKIKRRNSLNIAKKIFWGLLAILVVFQLYRINNFLLSSDNARTSNQIELMQNDINEVRELLSLPVRNSNIEAEQEETLESALIAALTEYQNVKQIKELEAKLNTTLQATLESPQLNSIIQNPDLKITLENPSQNSYTLSNSDGAILGFKIQNGKLLLDTPKGESELSPEEFTESIGVHLTNQGIQNLIVQRQKVNARLAELDGLITDQIFKEALNSKGLKTSRSENILTIQNIDETEAGEILYSPESDSYTIQNTKNEAVATNITQYENLKDQAINYINQNSFPTYLEEEILEQVAEIETQIKSSNFQKALKLSGLKSQPKTQDDSSHIFNFVNENNESIIQIHINKASGEVKLVTPTQEKILNANLSPVKKNGEFNYLITGKHGSLTDTIIIAHIDETNEKVTLISIPRDLYVEERKINSYYAYQGMNGLKTQVEKVSGLHIENYALIDMYAFIDVIDYLGGIEVTLAEDLIDPSYKTLDNGVWGTLYYEAGTHHLNGKQALRVARSRHYSSDFARAKRQHLILEALKNKISQLTLRNSGTILKIGYTLAQKTETDLDYKEAIKQFLKYKNYKINGQFVLSTGNVLTSGYTGVANCEVLEGDDPLKCQGAYALNPIDNDWGLIRSYIRQAINS